MTRDIIDISAVIVTSPAVLLRDICRIIPGDSKHLFIAGWSVDPVPLDLCVILFRWNHARIEHPAEVGGANISVMNLGKG